MDMTQDDVLAILKLLEASDVDYLEVQLGELRLVASKSGVLPAQAGAPVPTAPPAAPPAAPPSAPEPAPPAAPPPAPEPVAAVPAEEGLATVTAPVVGVFYVAPEPGAPPFVEVGSRVEPGTTMGLVEVMKMFNSVSAAVAGEVVRVLVGNDEFVEFGQPLFLVRPA